MVGREAYHKPGLLLGVDAAFYQATPQNDDLAHRKQVIRNLYPYIEQVLQDGGKLNYVTRHLLGLFNGLPGARKFRRHLSENAYSQLAGIDVLEHALTLIPDEL